MSCLSYFYFFSAFNFPVYKTDIAKIKFCSKIYRLFKETYMWNSFKVFHPKINLEKTVEFFYISNILNKLVTMNQNWNMITVKFDLLKIK